jgi:hypothetical protein
MKTITIILLVFALIVLIGAAITGYNARKELNKVEVVINNEIIPGQYSFEEGIFKTFLKDKEEMQTGGGVITFQYNQKNYRVEIPTDAFVKLVVMPEVLLTVSNDVEDSLYYSTRGFGSSKRLSRIKEVTRK